MRNLLLALLAFALTQSPAASHSASPPPVYGEKGMVASRSTLASEAGIEVMQQGGNAVDGAVATAFALAVTYPPAGNLGGGGFVVLRTPDGEVATLDHRETAPAAAGRDMYLDSDGEVIPGLSTASHLASGVPGSVDGLLTLLEKYGSLPLETVIAPAIRLARQGFPLPWGLAQDFKQYLPRMQNYPASVAKFTRDGEHYRPGDIWRQEDLAQSLERIRDEGRAGFYAGETADLIVAEMQRGGGIITHADLAGYQSVWREPVRGSYRGHDIYGMGPPSSGGVLVQQLLNMLEAHDVAALGHGSSALAHLMVEAQRRAYADRAQHLGDPDFVEVPIAMLTDKAYARQRLADFKPDKASSSEGIGPGEAWPSESTETTHISVMDRAGMMVAFTTTLNSRFGSKIVVPGTGVLLNNEMDDFSIKPDTENQFQLLGREANAIAPGKRMLSSLSPTLVVKDGKPLLVTGSPGGATIITTTLQVIVNLLDHGMSLSDAVALPRFHHQWQPEVVFMEPYALSPDTQAALRALGHKLMPASYMLGDANSILLKDGVLQGMKDPRAAGQAVGF